MWWESEHRLPLGDRNPQTAAEKQLSVQQQPVDTKKNSQMLRG